jgi:hypothetical protein
MKEWMIVLHLACSITSIAVAADLAGTRVRKLHLKRDEIAQVHTAVGIATLIQVPDRPTSVVLGDTNAFKVEYLENAITIKPLSHSSKSNLYIYTEGRRFNVSLVTLPIQSADYIVYLEPEITQPDPKREHWRDYNGQKGNRDFTVTITRLGKSSDFLMVAFQVTAAKPVKLKPEWIWITQAGRTIAIQDLNLSGLEVTAQTPVGGYASVKIADLKTAQSLLLEWRSNSPVKIRLPEVRSWLK